MTAHTLYKLTAQEVKNATPGKHCDGGGLWLHQRDGGKGQGPGTGTYVSREPSGDGYIFERKTRNRAGR